MFVLRPTHPGLFGKVLTSYLAFSILAGVLAGLARPWLTAPMGATLLGSVLGILAFLALVFAPHERPHSPKYGLVGTLFAVIVGGLMGGCLGWWMLQRVEYWNTKVR